MKVRKLVSTILTFGLILILFVTLPYASISKVYAAENALTAKLNVNSQSVVKGKSFYLRVYNLKDTQTVSFTSSKPSVATVNSAGRIDAVSIGTSTISAKIYDNGKYTETLTCKITVGPPAVAVMVSKLSLELHVGDKAKLSYIVFPINTAETPVFSSNDEEIASVSAGGKVTAVSAGTTTVFCMIANGKYAKCNVTVVQDDEDATYVLPDDDDNDIVISSSVGISEDEIPHRDDDTTDSIDSDTRQPEGSLNDSEATVQPEESLNSSIPSPDDTEDNLQSHSENTPNDDLENSSDNSSDDSKKTSFLPGVTKGNDVAASGTEAKVQSFFKSFWGNLFKKN